MLEHHDDHQDDKHGHHRHSGVQNREHHLHLNVALDLLLLQLQELFGVVVTTRPESTTFVASLLQSGLLLLVREGGLLPGVVLGVSWRWHERSHVLQLGQVQRGLTVGRGRPNGHEPPISRVAILPVVLVARTAAEHNVQGEDEEAQEGANADGDVEGRKVSVNVLREERVIQVGGALFDCGGHDLLDEETRRRAIRRW